MRNFLAVVLSVIAVGVLLIAYGLLAPQVAASGAYAQPMTGIDRAGNIVDLTPRPVYAPQGRPFDGAQARPVAYRASYADRPVPRRVVSRREGRDWGKTAMVIGGSSAAGAGLGAIFGGKKGALIGAAIGGGAGTLFEVKR